MGLSNLSSPTFQVSGQNLNLSYGSRTASTPLQNTPNGVSGSAYVDDGQGDSAAVSFNVNNSGQENFTEAVGNPGSDSLTTVKASTNGTTVTQSIFNVLTGTTTTVKIKSNSDGTYSYSETDYSQNSGTTYSSNGQPASGQYQNAAALIKRLFA